jgi:lipoyl(octanoyl) transferase
MNIDTLIIRQLGRQNYLSCWKAMREFTDQRTESTPDEVWLLEHDPVFTQGQNGKPEHLLNPGDIPVVPIDRGGQITYHGPGQLVAYTLIDLKRKKFNIRQFVTLLEKSIIDLLAQYQIEAKAKCEAPGVYVNQQKICSIGLRVRRGSSYHGLALNVNMDLEPFSRINPCGFRELTMTQIADLASADSLSETGIKLIHSLSQNLGYTNQHFIPTELEKTYE